MRTPIVGLIAVALVVALLLSPLTALAGDGDFVWAKRMGSTDYDYGYGIAVDAAGTSIRRAISGARLISTLAQAPSTSPAQAWPTSSSVS
jgi:hypothetical protein